MSPKCIDIKGMKIQHKMLRFRPWKDSALREMNHLTVHSTM